MSADDVTTDDLLPWFGAGFLASGAAATDERVEDAALPFDRRRHGLIIGMGGAALVVESARRGPGAGHRPDLRDLGTVVANSAFHGTRLDVDHIGGVMERLVADVERARGLDRRTIAPETVFVSHETYTPARGGSASAEVHALRQVFGPDADSIVIANTKGFTGHPMGVGVEDALAVKMLETGLVPPVAELPRGGSGAGHAQPVPRRRLPRPVRAAAGGRLRFPDRDVPAALDASARRCAPSARRPGLRTASSTGDLAALAGA